MTASTYTCELADEVVEWISAGKPLMGYCRQPGKPGQSTVHDWRKAHPDFDERYLKAKDEGYDEIANRTRMTARGKGEDDGGDSTGDVQRDKLIIDTDLKLLAKWDPRRYGDRLQLANDPDLPLTKIDDKALDERIAELMAKGQGKD